MRLWLCWVSTKEGICATGRLLHVLGRSAGSLGVRAAVHATGLGFEAVIGIFQSAFPICNVSCLESSPLPLVSISAEAPQPVLEGGFVA